MAHYAFLDENNIVTEVIVGIDETELIEGLDPETWYGNFRGQKCVRTSYNNNIRGKYAGLGDTYIEELDVFVSPEPVVEEPIVEAVIVEETIVTEETTTEQEPTDV